MSLLRSLLVVATAASLATGVVVVTTTASAGADESAAVVRSAHFSPDTAGVDVYLAPFSGGATQLWVSDEKYGAISAYKRLAPGAYVVSMRPHGAPASTAATVTWTLNAKAGSAYTAAAIGKSASLQAVLLTDDLNPPKAGTGRVRVVQAASSAPSVSVVANGGLKLVDKLPFGSTSAYSVVPTGTWDVRATADSGSAGATTASVAVAPGSSSTLVVLEGAGGTIGLKAVTDAASTGVAPSGSVDAGAGGTATSFETTASDSSTPTLWTAGALLVALLSVGAIGWTRRRHALV